MYHQHKSFVEEGKGGETNSLKLNKNKPPQGSDATAGSAATATGDDSMKDVAHTQAVTGMFIEIANTVMVTCGLDGKVIFWDFGTKDVLHRVRVQPHTPSHTSSHVPTRISSYLPFHTTSHTYPLAYPPTLSRTFSTTPSYPPLTQVAFKSPSQSSFLPHLVHPLTHPNPLTRSPPPTRPPTQVALKSPAMMLQGFQDGGFVAVASQDRTVGRAVS